MPHEYYKLVGKTAVPCTEERWSNVLKDDRSVAEILLPDGVRISTIFLGLNHNFTDGPPHIFETMVFGGEHDGDMERYSTWEEAEDGHQIMVHIVCGDYGDIPITGRVIRIRK